MNKDFFIQIIIPCYNAEKYIEKTISSILNQSFQNFIIIIQDDKSDDNTLEIIKKINSDKIHILKTDVKLYVGGARNKAFEYSLINFNTIYTWFVDADDYIAENSLQTIYNYYLKTNADMFTINSNYIFNRKYKIYEMEYAHAPWWRIIKTDKVICKFSTTVKCCEDILQYFLQYESFTNEKIIHIDKALYIYSGVHQAEDDINLKNAIIEISKLKFTKPFLLNKLKQFKIKYKIN